MDKFEEYKFFAENTWQLSERRQAATQIYLAVNTALFTVLAFLVKDAGYHGWGLVLASLPLFTVGIIGCVIWYLTILRYKALVGWRYEQLMKLEQEQTMAGSHQFYIKEREDFLAGREKRKHFEFSRLETWLPGMFVTLYILYGLGLVLATMRGLI